MVVGLLSASAADAVFHALADATRRHKLIFLVTTVGVIAAALSIYFSPSVLWLVPIVIAYAFLAAPIMPLMDSSTMVMLQGRKDRYGRIRVWGTLGWAIGAPLTGWLVGQAGLRWAFEGPVAGLETYREGIAFAARRGLDGPAIWSTGETTWCLYDLGRWDDVLARADEVLAESQSRSWSQVARFSESQRAKVLFRRGKLEDVNEAFRAMKAGEVARTVLMFE